MSAAAAPLIAALAASVLLACGARTSLPDAFQAHGVTGATGGSPSIDAASADAPSDALPDAPIDAVFDAAFDAGSPSGCADGEREGFVNVGAYPSIAGCSGGFRLGGVMPFDPGSAPACPTVRTRDTEHPACGRLAGDDSGNPTGQGCTVADLCASGWHLCTGSVDVANHAATGCSGATRAGDPPMFFITRQSSDGCGLCASGTLVSASCDSGSCARDCAPSARTSNDVFGCGNFGATQPLTDCGPLDRFSNDHCAGFTGSSWSCDDDGTGLCEAYTVTHADAAYGGALCCRD